MTVILEQLFRGVICPALACALVLALPVPISRRRGVSGGVQALMAALATLSGYIIGHGLLVGWAYFAPLERRDWLPCVGMMVVALIVAEQAFALRHAGIRRGLRVVISTLAVWLVAGPSNGLVLAGTAVIVAGLWVAVESLAGRRAGAGPAVASLVALVAASAVLALSGSASFGQLTGALAACVVVLTLVAWRSPELELLRGASGMIVLVPSVLWLNLQRTSYAEVPVASAIFVAAAMLSGWVAELGPIRRLGPRRRAAVYLFAALVPAALAVLLAWSAAEPAGDYDY